MTIAQSAFLMNSTAALRDFVPTQSGWRVEATTAITPLNTWLHVLSLSTGMETIWEMLDVAHARRNANESDADSTDTFRNQPRIAFRKKQYDAANSRQ